MTCSFKQIEANKRNAAVLSRKYEASLERGLYRALKEFREVQVIFAQTISNQQVAIDTQEEMGSSLPETIEPDGTEDQEAVESVKNQKMTRKSPERHPVEPIQRPVLRPLRTLGKGEGFFQSLKSAGRLRNQKLILSFQ